MNLQIVVALNQCGAAMELHGAQDDPILLELIRPAQLAQYQRTLGPAMAHAVMGQVALMLAQAMYPEVPVSMSANPEAFEGPAGDVLPIICKECNIRFGDQCDHF